MTKEKIIHTALETWGKNGFKNMSLSLVSQQLKISKAALYKHFKNKASLIEETKEYFLFTLLKNMDQFLNDPDHFEAPCRFYIKHIVRYFLNNLYLLDFYNIVLISKHSELLKMTSKIEKSLLSLFMAYFKRKNSWIKEEKEIKYFLFYTFNIVVLYLSFQFSPAKRDLFSSSFPPSRLLSEEQINQHVAIIESILENGFFSVKFCQNIDFEKVENVCTLAQKDLPVREKLLDAIADVVAEMGIWNTSTDKIAQKLGMSKSSLYYYFNNKNEMINKMLRKEVLSIANIYCSKIEKLENFFEKLYGDMYITYQHLINDIKHLKIVNWIHFQDIINTNTLCELFWERHKPLYEGMSQHGILSYGNSIMFPIFIPEYQISESIVAISHTKNFLDKNIIRFIYKLFINGSKEDISCQ